ncbi:MAG: translocation/assembly module TamB domain-containing protein, partial [Psychromonas sp.]|nr:translocation/assembly module TamB domain-containing protein [Psychromonas sp.]
QLFPYKAQPQVNALLDLKLPDLSPLALLTPELDKLKGQLSTQLTVNGSFSNPVVDGQININDGTMTAVNLPVQIDRFNTLITIKNNRATIDGRFYSGGGGFKSGSKTKETFVTDAFNLVDKSIKKVVNVVNRKTKNQQDSEDGEIGRANIKGTIDWRHKLKGNIHFSANKIAVYDYDKVDLLISPDLQLDIAEELKLSGKLLVNKGTITVKELPEGAVTLSQDVIVVDIKRSEGQSNIPLIINLQVKLGQQFSVQAFGLDSIVKGNLLVRKTLKKNPAVYGELTLDDGSYRAFGQQLILQNSRIIFQGPVDSPYISIEAIRDPNKIEDNVTAGVRVNGTPNKLSLVVFSDPAMAQQEALSYILRGQSLQNSTGNSGSDGDSQIASLLINLGADKSARVINSIGNELGIKDLSVAASGSGEEQSIGVSGYIAPNVEVSYGIGVFDSFSMFAIRYQMFERFYIEASSGVEQAVDAYYKFYWN